MPNNPSWATSHNPELYPLADQEEIKKLPACVDEVGRRMTQSIERKHLVLRTRIKRTRKTICFSRSEIMHILVISLFINRYEFGLEI